MEIGTKVVILTPLKGVAPESFDAQNVYRAISRGTEVALCTPVKAPELLATFSEAFGEANRLLSKIEMQYNLCDEYIRRRKSVLVLDEMADIIAAKGHSSTKSPNGTAEIREAVVDGDDELSRLRQTQIFLKCLLSLWGGHRRKLEMDHGSVKKILERGMYDRQLSVAVPADNTAIQPYRTTSNNPNIEDDIDF